MMEDKLTSASFEGKSTFTLPPGATIIKKDYSISVKEIENGFIVRKSYDIQYESDGEKQYNYYTKEIYSKTNPLSIKITGEKSLADKL